MAKYDVVDADGHLLEPPDLWERYIDPAFRDRAPIMLDVEGMDVLSIEGKEYGKMHGGLNYVGAPGSRDGSKQYAADMRYVDGARGGFDPGARIVELDSENIDAVFLYPSLTLAGAGMVDDPLLAAAICRAYNRYVADFCSAYPERLFGVAALPMQSVEAALEELEFAFDELNLRQAFIRPNPYMGRLLSDPAYDILWASAQDRDIAIGLHEGTGGMSAAGLDRVPPGQNGAHIASHAIEMMLASLNLIWGGVCDRFPRLHFGFLECSGGWMAGWLDRMDRHYDQVYRTDGPETRPSEIFARQCWISYEPVERTLPYLVEFLGPNKILWATDYPHRDSFTGAPKLIADLLPERHRRAVLGESAVNFYRMKTS